MYPNEPLESVLHELGRYVVPICVRSASRKTPHFLGSGIPFTLGGASYLATAAHVIDGAAHDQLLIAGNSEFLTFGGPCARWPYTPGQNTDYDVVVYRLHPKYREAMEPFYAFTTELDFSDVGEHARSTLYAFVGYPHSKNQSRPSVLNQPVESKPFYYAVRELVNLQALKSADKNEKVHVAFRAIFKNAITVDLERRQPPKPHGISGCPVWKMNLDLKSGLVLEVSLAGMAIEYHSSGNAFVATRSKWLLSAATQLQQQLRTDQAG